LVTVAHSMLAALWHMLQHEQGNRDLGADYFDKTKLRRPEARLCK
jgi:hypothetical protein